MDMIGKDSIIPIMAKKDDGKQSVSEKVKRRIYRRGRGSVFTADDFLDLDSRASIDLILARLSARGTILRIARGLYSYPIVDTQIGVLSPSVDAIAAALAGEGRLRLQPSGAYAANLLGLSEQVPMKIIFLTDGPSRHIVVGNREIILKRTTPRNMATAGTLAGLVIQALRYLGEKSVDDTIQARLRKAVPSEKRGELLKNSLSAPAWIHDLLYTTFSQKEDSE